MERGAARAAGRVQILATVNLTRLMSEKTRESAAAETSQPSESFEGGWIDE